MIVDIHANLYHPKWYPKKFRDSLVRDFIKRQKTAGRTIETSKAEKMLDSLLIDDDGTKTIKLMDKVGFDKKYIMIMDWGLALGEADRSILQINEDILGICARFPDRIHGFAGIDPRRENAPEMLRRAINEWGAIGLKLHPTTGWRMCEENTHKLVSVAVECKMPVLVHIGKTTDVLSDKHAQPDDLVELATNFPNGNFIAGHSGYLQWPEFARNSQTPENLYFDISGWQELVDGDFEKLTHLLDGILSYFPRRVFFGTDGPFYSFNLVAAEKHWLSMVLDYLKGSADRLMCDTGNMINPPFLQR